MNRPLLRRTRLYPRWFSIVFQCFSYPAPVFYMRDPFVPPQRVKGRKRVLSDFLILGSSCSLCNQSVCLDKVRAVKLSEIRLLHFFFVLQSCSVYFGALFCTTCIIRERRRFPEMLLQVSSSALINSVIFCRFTSFAHFFQLPIFRWSQKHSPLQISHWSESADREKVIHRLQTLWPSPVTPSSGCSALPAG